MSPEHDLAIVTQQEALLRLPSFSADLAWDLVYRFRQHALTLGAPMSFEVQIAGRTLAACASSDAPAGQADWIRRKRNTVLRFGRSSYALSLELERDGQRFEQRHTLPIADYAMHGGGFPIVLLGTGLVGSIIASGLHQRQDHILVVTELARLTGIDIPQLP